MCYCRNVEFRPHGVKAFSFHQEVHLGNEETGNQLDCFVGAPSTVPLVQYGYPGTVDLVAESCLVQRDVEQQSATVAVRLYAVPILIGDEHVLPVRLQDGGGPPAEQ